MAMVPDNEFSEPTLMFGPDVSTHESDFAVSFSVALLPQPDSARPTVTATPVAAKTDRFSAERRSCIGGPFVLGTTSIGLGRPIRPPRTHGWCRPGR